MAMDVLKMMALAIGWSKELNSWRQQYWQSRERREGRGAFSWSAFPCWSLGEGEVVGEARADERVT
jgi:hypothetical protein